MSGTGDCGGWIQFIYLFIIILLLICAEHEAKFFKSGEVQRY